MTDRWSGGFFSVLSVSCVKTYLLNLTSFVSLISVESHGYIRFLLPSVRMEFSTFV